MGGSKQPYLYEPVTHAPFNPKAYSQARANPQAPKQKPAGPLLNFNHHPDAWENKVHGRHEDVKPMSAGTKKRIIVGRKIQLGWRVLQLVASLLLFVGAILVKGAADTQGWILRIPPAFDLLISIYALWHLSHSPTNRPSASSASYHAFALVMDICFIPFFAFTTILARNQWLLAYGTSGRWRTLVDGEQPTNMILNLLWLIAAILAGFHAVTMLISAYLCLKFREIAALPPDMNPLEDNLTSRTRTKHKYKNSDLSALVKEDKRLSEVSARGQDAAGEDELRMSQTSERLMGDNSAVSFFSSRNGHDYTYNPHNPETAQVWHVPDANIYRDPETFHDNQSTRSFRGNFPQKVLVPEYESSRLRSPMPNMPQITKRHSGLSSPVVVRDESSIQHEDNWEHFPGDDESNMIADHDYDPYRALKLSPQKESGSGRYTPLHQHEDANLQPLRMNPPTPEPKVPHFDGAPSPLSRISQGYAENKENGQDEHSGKDRTHTMMSGSSSVYSAPSSAGNFNDPNAQKTRFYTDLAAAMRGVRHVPTQKGPKSVAGSVHTHVSTSTATSGEGRALPAKQGDLRVKTSGTVVRKQPLNSYGLDGQNGYVIGKASPSRVVSRSGADLDGMSGDLGVPGGWRGKRDVSGKVAEEGRGGGMWRRTSGQNASR